MTARTHVQVLPAANVSLLRIRLAGAGFKIGAAPYANFDAAGANVRVVSYKSGKLVVQGAGTEEFLEKFSDVLTAAPGAGDGALGSLHGPTIGSDESGKGDYFGSLVVAACRLTPADLPLIGRLGVRDSKQVGDAAIIAASARIVAELPVAVVELEPEEYNREHERLGNVNRILGESHARAIRELLERGPCSRIVVDRFGDESHVASALGLAARGIELVQVPRAEENPAVAAASFVARARFLQSLERGSIRAGMRLPPGASTIVDDCARRLVAAKGPDILARVAKVHFRTTDRILGRTPRS